MLAHNTFCLVLVHVCVCVCCFCISASALISVVDLVWHISRLVCALPILLLFIQKFDAKLCGGPSIRKFFDFFVFHVPQQQQCVYHVSVARRVRLISIVHSVGAIRRIEPFNLCNQFTPTIPRISAILRFNWLFLFLSMFRYDICRRMTPEEQTNNTNM